MSDGKSTLDEKRTGDRLGVLRAWLRERMPSASVVLPGAIGGVIFISIALWLFLPTVLLVGKPPNINDEFEIALDKAIE
jgi:hypothetical protein